MGNVQSWKNYSGVAPESPPGSRSRKVTGNKDQTGQQRTPREPAESHYSGVRAPFCLGYFGIFSLWLLSSLPEGNALAVLYQISHLLLKISSASQDTFCYVFLNTRNKTGFTISLSPRLRWLSSTGATPKHPTPSLVLTAFKVSSGKAGCVCAS